MDTSIDKLYKNIHSDDPNFVNTFSFNLQRYNSHIEKYNNYNYNIIIIHDNKKLNINTEDYIKLFEIFMLIYSSKSRKKKQVICMDCEYKYGQVKEIALIQLNFEISFKNKNKYIWFIDPTKFGTNTMDMFIKHILINKNIFKIFQGGDSRDIPYIFDILLKNNKDHILKFLRTYLDTKYLCEYLKICLNEIDKKCNIYTALLYMNIISEEIYSDLKNNYESFIQSHGQGAVENMTWNIDKLSNAHIRYAFTDVIYLKNLYINILKKINDNKPEHYVSFLYINKICRFILSEKQEISNIKNKIKKIIDPINNFFMKKNNKNIKLIEIYNFAIKDFMVHKLSSPNKKKDNVRDNMLSINNLFNINFFREYINNIFKFIIYSLCLDNHIFYEQSKKVYGTKINVNDILHEIKTFYGPSLFYFFHEFKNQMEYKLKTIDFNLL